MEAGNVTPTDEPGLGVDRAELAGALKTLLPQVRRRRDVEPTLTFDSGLLRIRVGGVAARARAEGSWQVEAIVPRMLILALASELPPVDPVPIWIEGSRIHVGPTRMGCRVQSTEPAAPTEGVQLPAEPTLLEVLRLTVDHTEGQIRLVGLLPRLRRALEEQEKRTERAINALVPLGVTPDAVRSLVSQSVREGLRDFVAHTDGLVGSDESA